MSEVQFVGYGLAAFLMIIAFITSYMKVKARQRNKPKKETSYKIDKTKGYDYNNPKRFFNEPLMRYIFTPMVASFGMIAPFAVVAGIMNDGGKFLLENYPFVEYVLYGWLASCLPLLIAYTVLYLVRGWGDKGKWKMEYA